jgi:hypothetical protein
MQKIWQMLQPFSRSIGQWRRVPTAPCQRGTRTLHGCILRNVSDDPSMTNQVAESLARRSFGTGVEHLNRVHAYHFIQELLVMGGQAASAIPVLKLHGHGAAVVRSLFFIV